MLVLQLDSRGYNQHKNVPRRACGAIALVDAMRAYGIERTVEHIWPQVAMPSPVGSSCAKSHRLAGCARHVGLDAVAVQCRETHAWDALRFCTHQGLTAIINHRSPWATDEGHFSILESITADEIVLKDPFLGGGQRWDSARFLPMWRGNAETPGHVIVAIGDRRSPQKPTEEQQAARCPRCHAPVNLGPKAMEDLSAWAGNGIWRRFFCVGCDAAFSPR